MPLQRTLGIVSISAVAIGMILGAGIYSVIGAAAAIAGGALWLSFAAAAFAALLTALSYAELATMMPRAGAEVVYAQEALPRQRWLPSVLGALLVLSKTATASVVSLAFAGYLSQLADAPTGAVAVAFLVVVTAINLVGIRQSAWVNTLFTIVEVGGLLLVIAVGAGQPELGRDLAAGLDWDVLPAAALVFFAYLGFEDVAALAEEARAPERDLPRAILVAVAVTTALYVLVAVAVIALVPVGELAASEAPLATAVAAVSPRLAAVLGAVALFATANTGLVAVVVSSRLLYGMAQEGHAPEPLGRIWTARGTPWIAAFAVLALGLALLPLGGVAVIASLSSFGALVGFLAVNASVIALRLREPDRRRPFRVPLAVGRVPVLPALGILASLALAAQFDAAVYAGGAAAAAAGAAFYAARGGLRR